METQRNEAAVGGGRPPPERGSSRVGLLALFVGAMVLGALAYLGWQRMTAVTPPAVAQEFGSLIAYPEPRAIAPFELVGDDGAAFGNAELAGQWTMLFFGFTHCPGICPTTLQTLSLAEKQMDSLSPAERPSILFVSVDPERDSPQRTGEYARHFSPRARGATGSEAGLDSLKRSVGAVSMRDGEGDDDGSDYNVDHSASVLIIDPQGRLRAVARPPIVAAALAADLSRLIRSGDPG